MNLYKAAAGLLAGGAAFTAVFLLLDRPAESPPASPQTSVPPPLQEQPAAPPADPFPWLMAAPGAGEEQQLSLHLEELSSADLEKLLLYLAEQDLHWTTRRAVISLLAKQHPQRLAEWASVMVSDKGERAFVLRTALWHWTMSDRAEALSFADGLAVEDGRDVALRSIFQAWATLNPAEAAERVLDVEDFPTLPFAIGTITLYWAEQDLDAATAWAWALPEGAAKNQALTAIIQKLSRDGSGRLPKASPEGLLDQLGSMLSPDNPALGAQWLKDNLPGGMGKNPTLQIQVAQWAAANPDQAKLWAAMLEDDLMKNWLLDIIAQAVGREDPRAALEMAHRIPSSSARYRTVYDAVYNWYAVDPDGAVEYAANLDDPGLQQAVADALEDAEAASAEEPSGTEETADSQEQDEEEEPGPMEGLSTNPADWSWPEIVSIAEQLPDGELRRGLVRWAATEWARDPSYAPSDAADWAASMLDKGMVLDQTTASILTFWAEADLEAAITWVQTFEGEAYSRGLSALAIASAMDDPDTATQLAEAITDPDIQRNTVGNLAYRLTGINEDAAIAWANSFSDPELRSYALSQVAAAVQNL